jgi:cytochrome c-type biogenesis protein CcmH/NrfG
MSAKDREREAQHQQARVLVRQAGLYRTDGRLGMAEAAYLKALKLMPKYPLAVAGLVRIHLQRRDATESLRWAKVLVALQPNRGNNQLMLGDAYALASRPADAQKAWTQAKRYGNAVARERLR